MIVTIRKAWPQDMTENQMDHENQASGKPASAGKGGCIAGWVITALLGAFLFVGAMANVLKLDAVVQASQEAGMPTGPIRMIGLALLVSVVLYVIPPTAVLGAVLLTGYFGGACAVHVIREDPTINVWIPVIIGVVVWLGIYLREARLRAILPWRR